jgi:hypothetical protein
VPERAGRPLVILPAHRPPVVIHVNRYRGVLDASPVTPKLICEDAVDGVHVCRHARTASRFGVAFFVLLCLGAG